MKRDRPYLLHAREAAQWALDYAETGKINFLEDRKTQDAIIRNLEILGEAVKQLSDDLKNEHPEVPWKQIAGLRDKLIHEYFGVNLDLIWEVVETELPKLVKQLKKILTGLEQEIL